MPRKSTQVTLICTVCNTEYKKPASKAEKSKFCSKACKDKKSVQYSIAQCLCCKKEFKSKRGKTYCSRACYLKKNKKERVNLKCEYCGIECALQLL